MQDEHGRPTTAGFLIRDALDRIYPNISKRLEPDFFFQPQVYRRDGETLALPRRIRHKAVVSRGPEYDSQTLNFDVPGVKELALRLARWIDPSRDG